MRVDIFYIDNEVKRFERIKKINQIGQVIELKYENETGVLIERESISCIDVVIED